MSCFQIDGEWWDFTCETLPAEEGFAESLELIEVYRYEGKQKIQYDGYCNEYELTALAEKAMADMNEY